MGFIGGGAALAKLSNDAGNNSGFNRFPGVTVGVHQEQRGIVNEVLSGNVFHRAGEFDFIAQDVTDGLGAAELKYRYINAGQLGLKAR